MQRISAILLALSLTPFACTKQASQQPAANSTTDDARHDVSNVPGTVESPDNASGQEPITSNPNSARGGSDTTINSSRGAAVVGDSNLNPAAEGQAGKTPTSVDSDKSTEPKSDAAVNQANCRDNKDCPPTAQSPMTRESTTKDLPKK